MRSPKVKVLLVALLIAVVIGFGVSHQGFPKIADCEIERVYQRVTSPDKYWEARVADHICEGAFASTTVALYVVEIFSKTNAADRHVIFSSDDCCYKDHIPAVAWRNRKSLQITINQSPLIGLQEISSVGIAISYKYKN